MKRTNIFMLFATLSILMFGCKPDLVVKNLDVTWNEDTTMAKAVIANIGNKNAGNFMVYFNAEEDPVSPNHRPQVSHNINGLAKGDSVMLEADFKPLAHSDNEYLANVYKIVVLADPKGMVAESNENNNSMEVAAALPKIACVDFGPPPAAATQYGTPAGNAPGDVVLTTPGGIKMSVENFRWTGGGGAFNFARAEMPPSPFGAGQTINTNNINLKFDFTSMVFSVAIVTFDFLDMGGFENFAVNGQPFPIYAGELTAVPSPIAGVNIVVTSAPVPGGKTGTVELTGNIQSLTIGGQELWIDNVCAKE